MAAEPVCGSAAAHGLCACTAPGHVQHCPAEPQDALYAAPARPTASLSAGASLQYTWLLFLLLLLLKSATQWEKQSCL